MKDTHTTYSDNCIHIEATPDVIQAMREKVESPRSDFDFQNIKPLPAVRGKYPPYMVRQEVWGTPELPIDDDSDMCWGETSASLYFWTKCGRCLPVIEALAEMYPTAAIIMSYMIEDIHLCGVAHFSGGKMVYQMEGSFEKDNSFHDYPIEENYGIPLQMDEYVLKVKENPDRPDEAIVHFREYSHARIIYKVDGVCTGKPLYGEYWPTGYLD